MRSREGKLKYIFIASTLALTLTVSPMSAIAAEYEKATVVIDGTKIAFTQQDAIVKNGATLVPMREVFNNLNATVSWNQATKTVTAVKGSTKITLTIGSKTAYIGSTKVTLTQTPEVINGATLVPLRFVSEALGAKVNWNQQTSTVTITSQKEQAPSGKAGGTQSEQVVNGIKVKHGKHHYESENQAQYDKVMEIVENNLKGYKDKPFYTNNPDYNTSAEFRQGLEDYLNNDIIAPFDENFGDYYLGNKEISYSIKDMVNNGVSKQEAIEAFTVWGIAIQSMNQDSAPTSNNTTIRSAYDSLVKGLIDCDSWSNTVIAHFDSANYSTAIIAGNNHATPYVKIGNSWYELNAGIHFHGKTLTLEAGQSWYTAPTF